MNEIYCKECGSCGEDGCCPVIKCAFNNMVKNGNGLYCKLNYKQIEFNYYLGIELFNKYQDSEIFDRLWDKIFKQEEENEL